MVHRITPTHWPPIVWLIFFPALASLIAASRVKQDAELWTWPADLGSATALSEPALLADPPAVLWRTDAALVYQTLDGSHAQQEILRYPDVHPRRWQVAPAERGRYHIVWLEDNNRLRSALISTDGETLRGPILLADAIRPDFVTVPAGESLIVVWINDHADEVNALAIDPAGRPGPITNIPVNRVSRVAAARDEANTLHLAWLTAPTPGTWAVHYQAVSATSLNMNSPITMQSLSLAPGESITGLEMNLDVSHGYILLGTSDRPNARRRARASAVLSTRFTRQCAVCRSFPVGLRAALAASRARTAPHPGAGGTGPHMGWLAACGRHFLARQYGRF